MPEEQKDTARREAELAAREAALAAREAELAREQAQLEAEKAAVGQEKRTLLNNGDPSFKNPKEKIYDHFPLTVHQLDILIGVLCGLIALFLFLGINHIPFFGLFGG